ncbi:MAG: caspase family protein [Deltaproteobacteria bacterium]
MATIQYCFVSEGSVPQRIEENAFYVDVGSIQHPHVFDHHGNQADVTTCPSTLIWNARERLQPHNIERLSDITIYTHKDPDWNACWGVALLTWMIEGKQLDEAKVNWINTYSSYILAGLNPSDGPVEKSAYAIFESIKENTPKNENDPVKTDIDILKSGRDFMAHIYEAITGYDSLKTGYFLTEDGPFGRFMLMVREDYQIYLADLNKARRFTARIKQKSGAWSRIDGLKLEQPLSRCFKVWARSDTQHSYFKAGFPLMWVQWPKQRWILSINPTSGYRFDHLGDFLTAEENRINSPDSNKPDRAGYSCPNPWYDGRNTQNEGTIVDSPTGGTRIPVGKIEKLLKRHFRVKHWRPVIEKPRWLKDKFIPYGLPALVLTVLIMLGGAGTYYVKKIVYPCDKWQGLQPITLETGRKYAIIIGINTYVDSQKWPELSSPKNDAERLMAILTQKYDFEKEDSGSTLLVSGGEQAPIQDNIKAAIKNLAETVLTENDSLLIFFAGHGEGEKENIFGSWVPQDCTNDVRRIENSWLQRVISGSRARHILVISDSCYSLKLKQSEKTKASIIYNPSSPPKTLVESYLKPSRQGITAGGLEPVYDGTHHSPFATCLFKCLEEAAASYLSASTLFQQIKFCAENTPQAKIPKRFRFESNCELEEQGEFVFRKRNDKDVLHSTSD